VNTVSEKFTTNKRTVFSTDTGMTEIFLRSGPANPVPPEYLRLYYLHCLVAGMVPDILEEDPACQRRKMDRAWDSN
jgi:hypothetical protein